jgi:hypothetical protein
MLDHARPRYVLIPQSHQSHRKWIGLTMAERGAWLTVLIASDIAYPKPLRRIDLEVLLRRDDPFCDAAGLIDRLVAVGALDHGDDSPNDLEDDELPFHNLYLFHVTPSQLPAALAERKRRQREREHLHDVTDVTPVTAVTSVTEVTTPDPTRPDPKENVDIQKPKSIAGAHRTHVRGFTGALER